MDRVSALRFSRLPKGFAAGLITIALAAGATIAPAFVTSANASTTPALGVYTGAESVSGNNAFASTTGAHTAIAGDYQDGSTWSSIESSYPSEGWTGSGYQLALGVDMLPNLASTYGTGASGSTTSGSTTVTFTKPAATLGLAVGDSITDQSHGTIPFDATVTAVSGDTVTLSVAATGSGSGSGEQDAWSPYTLAQGAAGAYNGYFQQLAKNLVADGNANAILHLGWEWDQPNPWMVNTPADAANFAAYWQQIVTAMRAVPGAAFNYAWYYGGSGSALTTDAWPGAAYVSSVDLDFYDQSWDGSCGLSYNNTATSAQSQCIWNRSLLPELTGFATFAARYGEPMGFGEWGVIARSDGHGLGDDPTFVNNFASWIESNNVEYADYFDVNSGGNSILTDYPSSLSAYKADFDGMSTTTTTAPPVTTTTTSPPATTTTTAPPVTTTTTSPPATTTTTSPPATTTTTTTSPPVQNLPLSTTTTTTSGAPGAPGTVTNLRAWVSGSTVNLSWTNPSNALGDDVFRNGTKIAWPGWPNAVVSSYSVTGLANGTYSFYVFAYNSSGSGPNSSTVTVSVGGNHHHGGLTAIVRTA